MSHIMIFITCRKWSLDLVTVAAWSIFYLLQQGRNVLWKVLVPLKVIVMYIKSIICDERPFIYFHSCPTSPAPAAWRTRFCFFFYIYHTSSWSMNQECDEKICQKDACLRQHEIWVGADSKSTLSSSWARCKCHGSQIIMGKRLRMEVVLNMKLNITIL